MSSISKISKTIDLLSESISSSFVAGDSEVEEELPGRNRCNSDHYHHPDPVQIPLDVAVKILARLPAKSLMRFACVCKSWCSIILDDPEFAELHRQFSLACPSGNRFMTLWYDSHSSESLSARKDKDQDPLVLSTLSFTDEQGQRAQESIQCIMIPEKIEPSDRLWLWPLQDIRASQTLDGLVCMYSSHYNHVFVLNMSTRQIVPLPSSHFGHDRAVTYYLCFDPVKKEYKVLNMFNGGRDQCEIYTLGTPSRRILMAPRVHALLARRSFSCSVTGAIYWISPGHQDEEGTYHRNGCSLIVFDVCKEVFRATRISEPVGDSIFVGELVIVVVEGKRTESFNTIGMQTTRKKEL